MDIKLITRWCVSATALAALVAAASTAIAAPPQYCDPLNGCPKHPTHYLKVSPTSVKAGHAATVHGSVGHGCQTPGRVTLYSVAFAGATTHTFAGLPAVYATASKKGVFSKRITINKSVKRGSYRIGGRCGGGNFGSAKLKVT
jgi:hypothetical protein